MSPVVERCEGSLASWPLGQGRDLRDTNDGALISPPRRTPTLGFSLGPARRETQFTEVKGASA